MTCDLCGGEYEKLVMDEYASLAGPTLATQYRDVDMVQTPDLAHPLGYGGQPMRRLLVCGNCLHELAQKSEGDYVRKELTWRP